MKGQHFQNALTKLKQVLLNLEHDKIKTADQAKEANAMLNNAVCQVEFEQQKQGDTQLIRDFYSTISNIRSQIATLPCQRHLLY